MQFLHFSVIWCRVCFVCSSIVQKCIASKWQTRLLESSQWSAGHQLIPPSIIQSSKLCHGEGGDMSESSSVQDKITRWWWWWCWLWCWLWHARQWRASTAPPPPQLPCPTAGNLWKTGEFCSHVNLDSILFGSILPKFVITHFCFTSAFSFGLIAMCLQMKKRDPTCCTFVTVKRKGLQTRHNTVRFTTNN